MSKTSFADTIRIGTMVDGLGKDPADYIRQILPHGFESFQISFWQTTRGLNLKELGKRIQGALEGSDAVVSSLAIFGNPLESGPIDRETLDSWKRLIDHAHCFGADIVAGFTGRLRGKSVEESIPRFRKVFGSLANRAEDRGVRLCFENCHMGGDWKTGDWNLAFSPHAWNLLFDAVPSRSVGLEWEPCHQMTSLIDPLPQLREWVGRIFHVHGKDANVLWDVVRRHGIHGPEPFVKHRTPGFGDTDWVQVISELRAGGFRGSIDIEGWHDAVYKDELEMTGQVHALRYLQQCRGGSLVPNPQ
ncbi:sugar phosphate isomerase/epimerase [soil metagenome]